MDLASHSLKGNSIFPKELEINLAMEGVSDDITVEQEFYDFSNGNYDAVNQFLSSIDLFADLEIESCVHVFSEIIDQAVKQFIPLKKTKSRAKPWMTSKLRNLRNRKSRAYKPFVRSGSQVDLDAFLLMKNEFATLNQEAYDAYIRRTEDSHKKNPKRFWNLVNSKRGAKGLPKSMQYHDHASSSDQEKCNMFSKFFQN